MKLRRVGALLGAVVLTFGVASSVFAVKPAFSITVDKVADPTTLQAPVAAGTMVTYWITVTNTSQVNGGGAFKFVIVSDDTCGAVTFSSSSDGSDPGAKSNNKLELGQWWKFTCQVDAGGWAVGTHTNTATADACHDGSIDQCNHNPHMATASGSATVTVLAPKTVTTAAPSTPVTSTSSSSSSDSSLPWLAAIIALASLIGLALAPRPRRNRQ